MSRFSNISADDVVRAIEDGDDTGFCLDCGSGNDGCEPDMYGCLCEHCGQPAVYGAWELLVMGACD